MSAGRQGLQTIRTLSRGGAAGRVRSRAGAHLKIAVLVLERERRMRERRAAEARIEAVDRRLSEIDADERALREWVGDSEPAGGSDVRALEVLQKRGGGNPTAGRMPEASTAASQRVRRLRY